MKKKVEYHTWEEWNRIHESTPEGRELLAKSAERLKKREIQKRPIIQANIADQGPVLADLREVGIDVPTLANLFQRVEIWRKDLPPLRYPQAIPVLIKHLQHPYHIITKNEITRALTDPDGYPAFEILLKEFQNTRDAKEAELRKSLKMWLDAGAGEVNPMEDLERYIHYDWEQYRFVLANAIGYLFKRQDLPRVLELISDIGNGDNPRQTLVEYVGKKLLSWKKYNYEAVTVLQKVAREQQYAGDAARKALQKLEKLKPSI